MVTLSLCMIVKNEETVLPRILGQMKHIADEIIIVDTGSSDHTKDIAEQYTPLVYDYPWKQDFAAARNFACSKASMDYWMWLDADDVIQPEQQAKLLELKKDLDPSIDVVMMKYLTGFDENGNVSFSYYRERFIKNNHKYLWKGRVHEAVTPFGNILHSSIEIEHRKQGSGDPDRNLLIYESMIAEGESLEPRHQFYYGRELYYHGRYQEAIQIFEHFLEEDDGWIENKIDACLQLSQCHDALGDSQKAMAALFHSFSLDIPRPEICCAIGLHLLNQKLYNPAIYWYKQALENPLDERSGAFIQTDYQKYIPYIQLCVCYDHLGDHKKSLEYHKLSMAEKPNAQAVRQNESYFQKLFSSPTAGT